MLSIPNCGLFPLFPVPLASCLFLYLLIPLALTIFLCPSNPISFPLTLYFPGLLSQHPYPLLPISLPMYAMYVSVPSSFYPISYLFFFPCSLHFPAAFYLLPCHGDPVYCIKTSFNTCCFYVLVPLLSFLSPCISLSPPPPPPTSYPTKRGHVHFICMYLKFGGGGASAVRCNDFET